MLQTATQTSKHIKENTDKNQQWAQRSLRITARNSKSTVIVSVLMGSKQIRMWNTRKELKAYRA